MHTDLEVSAVYANADNYFDEHNDSFTATLGTGRTYDIKAKDDLDLQFRLSVDSKGDARGGVGLTWRF